VREGRHTRLLRLINSKTRAQVYLPVKDVHVFSRAAEEALLFEPIDDRVARQHVNPEKTLHL
jgi:hypothetical protein